MLNEDSIFERLSQFYSLDQLIKEHIPAGSTITASNITTRFGSVCVDVHFTISDEYSTLHGLTLKNRVCSVRLIKADTDEGFPINSFADRNS
jgi:hypothetical protein